MAQPERCSELSVGAQQIDLNTLRRLWALFDEQIESMVEFP